MSDKKTNIVVIPRESDRADGPDDDDFMDDEDERGNMTLEGGGIQKLFAPIYIVVIIAFIITATIPLFILYSMGMMAWHAPVPQ
ncbi:hypothetical protein BH09SUM1_BH09SUM1_07160 [soil metagenome]